MNQIFGALVLFAISAYAGYVTVDDYRDGQVRILVARGKPLMFMRSQMPLWFWTTVAVNVLTAVGFAIGGILLLSLGLRK